MPIEIIHWSVPTVRGTVTTHGSEIHYAGDIDAVVAKTIVEWIEEQKYDTLRIQSKGGDDEAARSIGTAVYDHRMTVVIKGQCASACAKYVFTAARKKRIETDGLVVFSEAKSYHDFFQHIQALSKRRNLSGVAALSGHENRTLRVGENWLERDATYFAKIGVDIGITRLGYLPDRPVSYWLLTGQRMAEFGVTNVTLPDDYGSQEHCKLIRMSTFVNVQTQCL